MEQAACSNEGEGIHTVKNKFLFGSYSSQFIQEGENGVTWFKIDWLFAECYMYRRIVGTTAKTKHLKSFDFFQEQKIEGFTSQYVFWIDELSCYHLVFFLYYSIFFQSRADSRWYQVYICRCSELDRSAGEGNVGSLVEGNCAPA